MSQMLNSMNVIHNKDNLNIIYSTYGKLAVLMCMCVAHPPVKLL